MATKEEVAKIYVATFNRAADADGLAYWDGDGVTIDGKVYRTDATSLEDIASGMLGSEEVKTMYGDPSAPDFDRADFITKIYNNLFDRDPDEASLKYWNEDSTATNSQMIIAIVNGATGDDAVILDNKAEVGLAFADAGLNDVEKAKSVMSGVTADDSSVTSAKAVIKTMSPTDTTISISEKGETTADDGVVEKFDIATDSTYSHTIINFDTKNDKLDFGDGITSKDISIDNTADDGVVDLTYAMGAGETVVTITLTGLSSAEDMALTTSSALDSILG